MRNILSGIACLCIFLLPTKLLAQVYTLNPALNGTTQTTCSGVFYDESQTGNYSANRNLTVTFTPLIVGRRIRLEFTQFVLSGGDSLEIFDGPSTGVVRIGVYKTNQPAGIVVATNSTGSLTVKFTSDASTATVAAGWQAFVKCAFPCQPITGTISSTNAPVDANGNLLVCAGQSLNLTANISYPQNGTLYNQSNNNSQFNWQLGGFARDTAGTNLSSINKVISQRAGYNVRLIVTDSNGCTNQQEIKVKVRTSIKPTVSARGDTVCLNDTATIRANYGLNLGYFIPPPLLGRSIRIPDITQTTSTACLAPLADTIQVAGFPNTLTLTNVNDFLGVFMNMEHSYLGDLQMELTAPNGITVVLKRYQFGQGMNVFLGEPVDDESLPNVAGRGYDYGFTPTPVNPTMRTVGGGTPPTYSYINTAGQQVTNQAHLAAGTYASEDPLSALVGTPINGNWILRVCDNWTIDNGFLFNWDIRFSPNFYTNVEQYTIGVRNAAWVAAPGLVSQNNNIAKVFQPAAGVYNYIFRITDSANCVYDTSVRVQINPSAGQPTVPDANICAGQSATLSVTSPIAGATYNWYANSNSNAAIANGSIFSTPALNATTIYYVQAVNSFGCNSPRLPVNVFVVPVIAMPTVRLTAQSPTSLSFAWNAVLNATGYLVSLDNVNFAPPSSGPTGLTHTINGLTPLQTVTLYVRATGVVPCQTSSSGSAVGLTSTKEVFVPNAFSPNGDSKNDILFVYGNIIKTLDFKIFNQWGEMIFQTNDQTRGWDGSVSGTQQPVGVYVYVLKATLTDGTEVNKKGAINLVR